MRIPNTAIKRVHHPVPALHETLEKLKGATVFSKIDINWGYHQIVLHSDSSNITAFQDHRGLYRFKRLLFGVTSASEEYNHVIKNLFSVCPGVVSIFNDIIVFGKDKSEHDKNLDMFFKTLIQNGPTANPKKCISGVNEIEFFGFRISKDGIYPTESKIAATQAFKPPNNITELRSFLGMVTSLSDFIPHLATLLDPLRELTQKNILF